MSLKPESPFKSRTRGYWNSIAGKYRSAIKISLDDFHYGPLIPGDSALKLLPGMLGGLRCLELGCGRAQNSVFLARKGAVCEASDISESQLEGASALAAESGVEIKFHRSAMEDLPSSTGSFDLVHSAYALDFCEDPKAALTKAASLVKPGGSFLLSVGHPLFSGVWLELKDGEEGLFLKDYFNPAPDLRKDKAGRETVRATFRPVSETANMLLDAGFSIERMLEPRAEIPEDASPEELSRIAPYWSKGWLSYSKELSRIPVVAVFKCVRN